jgi:hypothetical protein
MGNQNLEKEGQRPTLRKKKNKGTSNDLQSITHISIELLQPWIRRVIIICGRHRNDIPSLYFDECVNSARTGIIITFQTHSISGQDLYNK